jgi:integrase
MKGHIRRRGEQSWELKFDVGRDPLSGARKMAYHSFRGTKRQAEAKLAELITSVGKGGYVARSSVTVSKHVTARIDQWEALGNITPKTAERYRELATNQIAPHLGAKPVQKLAAADIEQWHATLKNFGRKDGKGGLSGLTIRHAHRLLSKALKEAARHDLVIRNVAAAEPPPKVAREEITILTDEQVRSVVTALAGTPLFPPVMIALFTGLRRGEILALRWQHVDLDNKIIAVREAMEETKVGLRFKESKSDSGQRDVALPDIVVDVLREHRRQCLQMRLALGLGKITGDTLLFSRLDGGPRSPNTFSKDWAKHAAGLGLAEITFHALRHTHASHLIGAGVDVVRISKRLGHSSPTVTLDTYAHLFARREDKSAAAINDAVAALLTAR